MLLRFLVLLLAAAMLASSPVAAQSGWTPAKAENLLRWIERAPGEGITLPEGTNTRLRAAIDSGDRERIASVAGDAGLTLMRAWRGGCCGSVRPDWWHIDGSVGDEELRAGLEEALASDRLDLYLRSVRPSHPHYEALVDALEREIHAGRQAVIRANLARWRWLPPRLGERYLIVNIAAKELTLWENGKPSEHWRVIVGKPVTRTPVFTTPVSGVVLNPWWEIPSSIAAEGIASLVQSNPAAARARGYVYQNGRYRQMPGDNNALGRMKLVMPNPYNVFLHDTSNRKLFAEKDRFFSHGCVRVDRALSFVGTLLAGDGWDPAEVQAELAKEETHIVILSKPIPLYVTYFTAQVENGGGVRFWEDKYRRDPVRLAPEERVNLTRTDH